jgi:hypothetical protein
VVGRLPPLLPPVLGAVGLGAPLSALTVVEVLEPLLLSTLSDDDGATDGTGGLPSTVTVVGAAVVGVEEDELGAAVVGVEELELLGAAVVEVEDVVELSEVSGSEVSGSEVSGTELELLDGGTELELLDGGVDDVVVVCRTVVVVSSSSQSSSPSCCEDVA